eukprot:TRINITY_DN11547_c0_g1_i1.p1 TRINITY_DN11547_c0_g1~~TRINITY_DN11547_c0_g1_i1.p1  ORF type:complete len:738 (+),score=162.94 TRINITY_DN11547_c0_g1_i1:60-2273(+)
MLSIVTSLGLAGFVPGCQNYEEVGTTISDVTLSYMMGDYDGNTNSIQIELENTVQLGYTAFGIRWRNETDPSLGSMEDLYIFSMTHDSDEITVYEKSTAAEHPVTGDTTHKAEMVSREVNGTETKYIFNLYDLPHTLKPGDSNIDFAVAYGTGSPPNSLVMHTNKEAVSVTLACEVAAVTATETVPMPGATATATIKQTVVKSRTITEDIRRTRTVTSTLVPASTPTLTFHPMPVSVTATVTGTKPTRTASATKIPASVTKSLVVATSTATLTVPTQNQKTETFVPGSTASVTKVPPEAPTATVVPVPFATETILPEEPTPAPPTATVTLPESTPTPPTAEPTPEPPPFEGVALILKGCFVHQEHFDPLGISNSIRQGLTNYIVDMSAIGIVVTLSNAEDEVSGDLRNININVTFSGPNTEVVHEVASVTKQHDAAMGITCYTVIQQSASTSKEDYVWVWYILAACTALGCACGAGGYLMGCGKDTRVKTLDGIEQVPTDAHKRAIEQQLGITGLDNECDDDDEPPTKQPPMIPAMGGLAATFEKVKKSPGNSFNDIMAEGPGILATPRSSTKDDDDEEEVSPRRRKSSTKEKKHKKKEKKHKKEKRKSRQSSAAITDEEKDDDEQEAPPTPREAEAVAVEEGGGESGVEETREERRRRKKAARREREKDDPEARERRKAKKAAKKSRKDSNVEATATDEEVSPKKEKRRKSKEHKKEKRRKSRKHHDDDEEEVVIE